MTGRDGVGGREEGEGRGRERETETASVTGAPIGSDRPAPTTTVN